MKVALANPAWTFHGSIYFGCRHPHLPLEYGSAKVLLENAGHEVEIVDGHLFSLSASDIAAEVRAQKPDMTVVTTAPSYLFWRYASFSDIQEDRPLALQALERQVAA